MSNTDHQETLQPGVSNPSVLKVLVGFVFVLLFLPGLQFSLHLFNEKKLNGYRYKAENPDFSVNGWADKSYQQNKAEWVNEHFGFRNFSYRLHNQLLYSLWKKTNANGVVVGKDGYLFDQRYINALNGADFEGEDSIRMKVKMLATIQQKLQERGTTFLFVMAPGKASFFSEYLNDGVIQPKGPVNYEVYKKYLQQEGVNFLDFRVWFEQWKKTSQYPLFPQCGIHWSTYAATVANDSINRKIAALRGVKFAELIIDRVVMSDTANAVDSDLARSMNIFAEPKGYPLAYPQFHFDESKATEKPSMLVVGDSYFWTHDPFRFNGTVFQRIDFFYYNNEWHVFSDGTMRSVDTSRSWQEAIAHDVVMLICTDPSLDNFGWGFIEQTFSQMPKAEKAVEPAQIQASQPSPGLPGKGLSPSFARTIAPDVAKMMVAIRGDINWYASIKDKAFQKGIPVDSMLYLDAQFMVDEQKKKKK
ncbi:MAG: hypothetical protein MUC87_02975 [Bacteroidia bacterium]|nr:hypothetical protein [Bacteroidia bacterium]